VKARPLTRSWAVVASLIAGAAVAPLVPASTPAAAATTTFYRPADGVFHLAGHGYGHGHGMSQWGAYGGAQSGKTYQQILGWYYNNPTFATATGTIKVQITGDGRGSDGVYDTQVKPAAGLTAVDSAGHTLTLPTQAADGSSYDLYRAVLFSDGTFRVQAHGASGWVSLPPTGAGARYDDWTGWVRFTAAGGVLYLVKSSGSNDYYREALELDQTSGGSGITVNRLSLEHYLAGVVSSEMPCGWTPTVNGTKRLDALESQAVAARSYAAWRRQHPRSAQVDIVDSTSDQAYHGYSAEKTALTACPWTNTDGSKTSAEAAAVAATAGQVMVDSSGNPIFAQYSASNGGFETAGSQSYLPSRPDAWDGVPSDSWSSHSWTDSVTAGQIQAAYPAVGSLTSIAITGREALSGVDQNGQTVTEQWGGRITAMTLNGTAGSVSTTGSSFAGALGLMGAWFTVAVNKPAAPASVSATAGDAQATVRWSAPTSDGGGGIRGYTITASPAVTPVNASSTARSAVITGLANDTAYTFSVTATNTAGTGPAKAAATVTPSAHVVFHALPPTRIYNSYSTGALGAGSTRSVKVTGVGGVPDTGVVDVALDVIDATSTAASSFTVWAHGGSQPADPQLAWPKGQRVNDLIPVKVGSGGLVDIRNAAGSTQLFVDVEGYYTSAGAAGDVMTPAISTKLYDSGSTVPAGASRTFAAVGQGGMPSGATAAVVQITAAHPAYPAYVRAWASDAAKPGVYQLYAPGGRYSSSTAIVPLTAAGTISVSPTNPSRLIVKLLGWFTTASSPSSGVMSLLTPTHRLYQASVPAGGTMTLSTGLPSTAGGAVVSITGTGPVGAPISVYAAGGSPSWAASLNTAGSPVTATVVTPLSSAGQIAVRNYAGSAVQIALDVLAWSAR
jgi:stage II sporulation protein D